MKCVLNEIPVKTTNSFNINNLKIDLNIPKEFSYKEFFISDDKDIEIEYSKSNNFNSRIGLNLKESQNIVINIKKSIKKPVEFVYMFDQDNLVDNIIVNCFKKVKANLIFKYVSKSNKTNFHHLKQNINLDENSNVTITVINLLNENSTSLIASESNVLKNATLTQNLIDIGGNIKINNYYSIADKNAKSYLNNIYLGNKEDVIDMNYCFKNKGAESVTNIESQGVLNDNAKKNFRGTIDFISGCAKSIGKENENCVLLSDTCISRSVPILLCGEEDVEGAHSVSSGKIDEAKLFYITTKGIDINTAQRLIILSNFNKILLEIKNEKTENEILDLIEEKI